MARVKRGTKARRRRKRTMKLAEGFYGRRKNCFTVASPAVDRSLVHAYIGRKLKKRDFRALWIQRINAAARQFGVTYSRLMPMLKKAGVEMDRKMLAHLAATDIQTFEKIVNTAKAAG